MNPHDHLEHDHLLTPEQTREIAVAAWRKVRHPGRITFDAPPIRDGRFLLSECPWAEADTPSSIPVHAFSPKDGRTT